MSRVRLRALASDLAAWFAAAGVLIVASCSHRVPPGSVVVDSVPPDACVAYYGPGPCREHGRTVLGSTDAVALWPAPSRPRPPAPVQPEAAQ